MLFLTVLNFRKLGRGLVTHVRNINPSCTKEKSRSLSETTLEPKSLLNFIVLGTVIFK